MIFIILVLTILVSEKTEQCTSTFTSNIYTPYILQCIYLSLKTSFQDNFISGFSELLKGMLSSLTHS
jgi:ABC-type sulfate transport system permease component